MNFLMFSPFNIYFVLLVAARCPTLVYSAQGNFSVNATSYDCLSNLKCLGAAHNYSAFANESFAGRLSLVQEDPGLSTQSSAIAYFYEPVRMLDHSTRQSASFNTSFVIDEVMQAWNATSGFRLSGDGMAFVISADATSLGSPGKDFGFFGNDGTTNFRSVVVEFDIYQNLGPPAFDISGNHVSFDFQNISYVAAANASDVNVSLWYPLTIYAWVEYSAETQRLELRISNDKSRPLSPLLNYTVDLFDVVDEYMWVGFSAGSGDSWSFYYVGDWTFQSYGLPPLLKVRRLAFVVGISVGVSVLLAIAVIFIIFFVRRKYYPPTIEDPMLQLSGMPNRFSYKHLSVATKAFGEESKLGQGGFGSVYRGVLPATGTPVAVKKISGDSSQGEKEFMAEVSIISQIRHRNLIQLLGWCRDRGKYLIVYELMPNGSLDKLLFGPKGKHSALSWPQRFNIITGTAAALDYLHQGWKQQVIHRDIKSSNIMLDNGWNAKLGDFGLARLVDHLRTPATTIVAGTYGYIAPEAAASGKYTEKTDVFAFGAVVLEVACGRKAFAAYVPTDEIVLVDFVWQRLSEGDLLSVVDKQLTEYDTYWMEVVLLVGLLCSHPDPMARPSMRQVVQVLAGDAPVPSISASKPAPVFWTSSQNVSIGDLHGRKIRTSSRSRSKSGSISLTSTTSDSQKESSKT